MSYRVIKHIYKRLIKINQIVNPPTLSVWPVAKWNARCLTSKPVIQVSIGFIKESCSMSKHEIAFVLGHELGHYLLSHSNKETKYLECKADALGLVLSLNSGFRSIGAYECLQRFLSEEGFKYYNCSHPIAETRKKYLAKKLNLSFMI